MADLQPRAEADLALLQKLLRAVDSYRADVAARQKERGLTPVASRVSLASEVRRLVPKASAPAATPLPVKAPAPMPPPRGATPPRAMPLSPAIPSPSQPRPTLPMVAASAAPAPEPAPPSPPATSGRPVSGSFRAVRPTMLPDASRASTPGTSPGARAAAPMGTRFPTPTGLSTVRRTNPGHPLESTSESLGAFLRRFGLTSDS